MKIRTLRGRGFLENVRERTRGEGSKIHEIERTYFFNGPFPLPLQARAFELRNQSLD